MKVLHVVPTYWPATRYGGPIYSVHGLCAALAKKKVSVTVFTTSVDGNTNSNVVHAKLYQKDGVQIYYFESKILRRIYFSIQLKRMLEQSINEFDLVHLHSIFLYPTNIAARIAANNRVPYILSPRGMLEKALIKNKSPVVKSLWLKMFERKTLEQAGLLHLTSNHERKELNHFKYLFPKTLVIPNGVDQLLHDTIERNNIDVFQVLFIGRLNWKKQINKLIEAVMLLNSELRLVIAGNDEDNYKTNLQQLTDQLMSDDNSNIEVDFVGAKQGQEKNDLFLSSNVMVLPSLSENFGNTVIESLAFGCPVIVTPEVGASEVVRKADAGLITDGTAADIARKIIYIKEHPEQAAEMGRNGIQEIKENYQWPKIADSMIAAYEELIT